MRHSRLAKMMMLMGGGGVEMDLLPRWIESDNGTLIESFGDPDDFSITQGTKELNTTNTIQGDKAIKVTTTSGSTTAARIYRATSNWDFGGAAPSRLRLYFYTHDNTPGLSLYSVGMEVYTGGSPYFGYTKLFSASVKGWNAIDIYPAMWSSNGTTPDWANGVSLVKYVVGPYADKYPSVTLGGVYVGMTNTPSVMISFDDSHLSDYSIAYAKMSTLGIRGTAYTIHDVVDTGGWNTSENLLTMQAAGWVIGTHAADAWDKESNATADAAIPACISYLQGIGITDGWKHASYPQGKYDYYASQRLQANGILTGRLASVAAHRDLFVSRSGANNYLWGSRQIDASVSLATAKGYLDDAITNNTICSLFFHELVASGAASLQWNQSDFNELMDYIVTLGLPVVTPRDLYNSISGSITVPAIG